MKTIEYMTIEEKQEAIKEGTLIEKCDCDNCIICPGVPDCLYAECIDSTKGG